MNKAILDGVIAISYAYHSHTVLVSVAKPYRYGDSFSFRVDDDFVFGFEQKEGKECTQPAICRVKFRPIKGKRNPYCWDLSRLDHPTFTLAFRFRSRDKRGIFEDEFKLDHNIIIIIMYIRGNLGRKLLSNTKQSTNELDCFETSE